MTPCAPFGSTSHRSTLPLVFEHMFRYCGGMFTTGLGAARDLLREAVASVRSGEIPDDSALHGALKLSRELTRLVSQVQVETVAALDRSGGFAAAGYKQPESAV